MTNIRPNQTMENLQKIALPHKHTLVFANSIGDKNYWLKLWLIERLVQELGFEKVKQS